MGITRLDFFTCVNAGRSETAETYVCKSICADVQTCVDLVVSSVPFHLLTSTKNLPSFHHSIRVIYHMKYWSRQGSREDDGRTSSQAHT